MQEEFRNRLTDADKPMWLTQDQIRSWISRYHSMVKKVGRAAAAAELPQDVQEPPIAITAEEEEPGEEMDAED